jgi:ferritin-like metal-binding protein YciE
MNTKQIEELVLQSLEHEMGGVKVYTAAVACAVNGDLKKELEKYLAQTRTHVTALEGLVEAMKMARTAGDGTAAELVACECVVLAETKDHLDWELLSKCAEHLKGTAAETLKKAAEKVEDEEDEHLYHSKGWCRELWRQSLGLKAVLPPPEERKQVKTAIGAARAEQAAHHGR